MSVLNEEENEIQALQDNNSNKQKELNARIMIKNAYTICTIYGIKSKLIFFRERITVGTMI